MAMHDSSALNALKKYRPIIVAPSEGYNAFGTALCMDQCYALVSSVNMKPVLDSYGLKDVKLEARKDVEYALGLAEKGNDHKLNSLLN